MSSAGLDVRPLTPTIGAEVHGVDAAERLDDSVIAAIRAAWLEHLVLFFPDQRMDPGQQVAFARRFGEITEGHPIEPTLDENPQVLPIDSVRNRTDFWHTDVTFMSRPPTGSILRAVTLPPVGGDTMWADTRAAYDALAPPLQRLCDDLVAVHHDESYAARVEADGPFTWDGEPLERLDPVEHPVVRVHPETGRKNLFVNPGFTRRLRDVPGAQGSRLLRLLHDHMTQPDFVVRHHWRQGTVAFWDNRTTMHYGVFDYGDAHRVMHRVTLKGDRPVGPAARRAEGSSA